MPYATPEDLWRLALPPDSLFEEQGFEAGEWTDFVLSSGTGLGTLELDASSNPREAWTVRVLVARSGELNTPGIVNPGPLPQLRVQLLVNGVQRWQSRKLTPDDNGQVRVQRGGFTLLLRNAVQGAPVTLGSGNASLVFTPRLAGASAAILVGTALAHSFRDGALTLTVGASTTAAQAAAYLAQQAAVVAYLTVAAGGDGSGFVQAAGRTPVPLASFAQNDTWTCTTQPSPDVLSALQVASDLADAYLQGVYQLPLLAWADDLRLVVCQLARWQLFVRRGMDTRQDVQIYNPAGTLGTLGWLQDVQRAQLRPRVTQSDPGATPFPELVQPYDPLGPESGGVGI